jgi:hypothetical protein
LNAHTNPAVGLLALLALILALGLWIWWADRAENGPDEPENGE